MLPQANQKEITKHAVELCGVIWDGFQPAQTILYYLEYLCMHLPENRLEPGLYWLLSKGIKGKLFHEFLKRECKSSGLELMRRVTKGIERSRELRPIYAKDLQ